MNYESDIFDYWTYHKLDVGRHEISVPKLITSNIESEITCVGYHDLLKEDCLKHTETYQDSCISEEIMEKDRLIKILKNDLRKKNKTLMHLSDTALNTVNMISSIIKQRN